MQGILCHTAPTLTHAVQNQYEQSATEGFADGLRVEMLLPVLSSAEQGLLVQPSTLSLLLPVSQKLARIQRSSKVCHLSPLFHSQRVCPLPAAR